MTAGPRLADLVRRTYANLSASYAQANPGGPSLSQVAVLDCLKRHGSQPGMAIAGFTGIDRSTIFEMLARMKRDGLIAPDGLTRSPKAGKNPVAFMLTPEGKKALAKADAAVWAAEKHILAKLSPVERPLYRNAVLITAFATVKP